MAIMQVHNNEINIKYLNSNTKKPLRNTYKIQIKEHRNSFRNQAKCNIRHNDQVTSERLSKFTPIRKQSKQTNTNSFVMTDSNYCT